MSIGTFRFVRYFYFHRDFLNVGWYTSWSMVPSPKLYYNCLGFFACSAVHPALRFLGMGSYRPELLVGSPERVRLEAVVRQRRSRREFYSWWLRDLTGYFQEAATSQVSQTAISPTISPWDWPVHLSVKEWILTLATCGPQVMVSWPDAASGS